MGAGHPANARRLRTNDPVIQFFFAIFMATPLTEKIYSLG
jgi:hypothetical protein